MNSTIVQREELTKFIASELDITRFRDYCPNGLQVEGKNQIGLIISGVTASIALLEAAIASGADAVIVHHGYFWRGEDARVVGQLKRRLHLLLEHDVNLFAYHLPLDSHAVIGNNAQLGKLLGFQASSRFGDQEIGWLGDIQSSVKTVGELARLIETKLGRAPMLVGDAQQPVRKVAWCTGAAQTLFADGIAVGADVYISGEISEQTVHLSRESGIPYLACGHHATERYGVQALGEHVAQHFGIRHQFIDIPNPV
ncbi:MAG: Nif3-like dinuclear metal center hexameric protein [Oxalobacteraceae bacterium]|jgi:dinuclear metal center YbgI/SA1388 family protein|nr:Nif3-like dinuclear metal center hexameric protein [Oxalobacteraceae bacterium]